MIMITIMGTGMITTIITSIIITITATGPDQLEALHQDLLGTGRVQMVI